MGVWNFVDGHQEHCRANHTGTAVQWRACRGEIFRLVKLVGMKYSSRFATRTARTQGIGQRGKKRAYLAHLGQQEPSWAQLGRNLRRTLASWLQLGPTGAQLGSDMAHLGHVWTQVGLSMRNLAPKLGPRQAQCGQHGLARTSHQSQETMEIASAPSARADLVMNDGACFAMADIQVMSSFRDVLIWNLGGLDMIVSVNKEVSLPCIFPRVLMSHVAKTRWRNLQW